MTYIQPNHQKNILNLVIGGLIFLLLGGVFSVVALYNNVVNLNHNIATAKAAADSVGAQTSALNSEVIVALQNIQSSNLASADGLVQDNHPQYFSPSWPIASQQ